VREPTKSTVYKIVSIQQGQRGSMNAPPTPERIQLGTWLSYEQGEVTEPKFGALMAFDSEAAAVKEFDRIDGFLHLEIWKAEAAVCRRSVIHVAQAMPYSEEIIKWWHKPANQQRAASRAAPLGTVFCESIKLLERVRG